MSESKDVEHKIWVDMLYLWKRLEDIRPINQNEKARRISIAITEYQKAIAYFYTFVLREPSLDYIAELPQNDMEQETEERT